jgi:hypothetical protein
MKLGLLYEMQRPYEGTHVDENQLYKEVVEQCLFAENEQTQAVAAEQGINLDSGPDAARAAIGMLDADTLCDRGAIVGGDPDSCTKIIRKFEEIGVDQLTLVMQTETVPHEKVMKSLEMFGKYVLPAFQPATHAPAGAAS